MTMKFAMLIDSSFTNKLCVACNAVLFDSISPTVEDLPKSESMFSNPASALSFIFM